MQITLDDIMQQLLKIDRKLNKLMPRDVAVEINDSTRQGQCTAWLKSFLSDGPKSQADVLAASAEWPKTYVYRAAAALGMTLRRGRLWELPNATPAVVTAEPPADEISEADAARIEEAKAIRAAIKGFGKTRPNTIDGLQDDLLDLASNGDFDSGLALNIDLLIEVVEAMDGTVTNGKIAWPKLDGKPKQYDPRISPEEYADVLAPHLRIGMNGKAYVDMAAKLGLSPLFTKAQQAAALNRVGLKYNDIDRLVKA